tara:strand:+ start:564 stop:917 length:354 start_codon:yes stop_codon:yes gene_type:complete
MGSALRAVEHVERLRWQALNREALFQTYMPFVENGGFFIATDKDYSLGHPVQLIVTLLDEPETAALSARVIWSAGYQVLQYPRGIGIQLIDENTVLVNKIEAYLAAVASLHTATFTL